MPQTRLGNSLKQTTLTSLEKEVIEGCLLGDGTLSKAGRNYRLRIEHALRDKEYVQWKFRLLRRLCVSDIQFVSRHNSFRFGTVGHPEITKMRRSWYHPAKQVSSDMVLTPLMMAIWFMDDGTRHRDTINISVHSFSEQSLQILRRQIEQFGINTTVNSDAKGNRLYVLKKSYPNFKKLTSPYLVKCMARKWP